MLPFLFNDFHLQDCIFLTGLMTTNDEMRTTILTTCNNAQEASLIKGRLENEGIVSMLTNQNFSTLMPQMNGMLGSGVQVIVYDKDLDIAKEILGLEDSKEEVVSCPNCNSTNIATGLAAQNWRKIILAVFSALIVTPLGNIKGKYRCNDCKTEF